MMFEQNWRNFRDVVAYSHTRCEIGHAKVVTLVSFSRKSRPFRYFFTQTSSFWLLFHSTSYCRLFHAKVVILIIFSRKSCHVDDFFTQKLSFLMTFSRKPASTPKSPRTEKSQKSFSLFFEPSGGKSHAPDSKFDIQRSNFIFFLLRVASSSRFFQIPSHRASQKL